ncbi:MAG: glutathione S-transferase family protein [Gammaproteobacteria bacterium]
MITLYQFGPNFGLADPSPFCLKVDLYLRAAGLEFESKPDFNNLKHAPKGKLPYIGDADRIIADSSFIIDYLKQHYGDPLDQDLNPEQKAISHAFKKMLDENLYWCMVYSRWIDEKGWKIVRRTFFVGMPLPLKMIIPELARKRVKKSLTNQGLGRHSHNEILEIATKDLTALSELLGTKDYFLINKVTTLDVCAYALLAQFIVPEYESEFIDLARSFDNLVAFVERIKENYYRGH